MNNKPYLYLYYISRIYLTQALNNINVDFDILMYVMRNLFIYLFYLNHTQY